MKDPHNTVERLTNTLSVLVSDIGDGRARLKRVHTMLGSLGEDPFPLAEDKEKYRWIMEGISKAQTLESLDTELVLKAIWDLYWRMSSNQLYV